MHGALPWKRACSQLWHWRFGAVVVRSSGAACQCHVPTCCKLLCRCGDVQAIPLAVCAERWFVAGCPQRPSGHTKQGDKLVMHRRPPREATAQPTTLHRQDCTAFRPRTFHRCSHPMAAPIRRNSGREGRVPGGSGRRRCSRTYGRTGLAFCPSRCSCCSPSAYWPPSCVASCSCRM